MRFSYNWLKLVLNTNADAQEISEALTSLGLEVEKVIDRSQELAPFKIAHIVEVEQHPNADKLRVCSVNTGTETLQIVCGAPNARAGIKVVLAPVGTLIPNGGFAINKSTIRGVESIGMLCSENELLTGKDSDGIIELPADAPIGQSYAEYAGLNDIIFEIAITPNRGDCWSVYGIGRELDLKGVGEFNNGFIFEPLAKYAQQFEGAVDTQNLLLNPINLNWDVYKRKRELIRTSRDNCLQAYFLKLSGLKNTESPIWLRNFLKQAGLKPISTIVDVTNFVAHLFGQPLHAYDAENVKGDLYVDIAHGAEQFSALNNQNYDLANGDIVIRDSEKVQSLAGIMGGSGSACQMNTTSIILEAAVFNRIQIFKTGNRLGVHTDARARFERGVDHEMTQDALLCAAALIYKLCGGGACEYIHHDTILIENKYVQFDINFLKKRLGYQLDRAYTINLLEHLTRSEARDSGYMISVKIPSWRHDISIPEDIVEEIARIIGYDKLPYSLIPYESNPRGMNQKLKNHQISRRVLASIGYNELINYSFVDMKEAYLFGEINENLELLNPISANMNYMRSTIIHSLCNAIHKNEQRFIDNLWLFEVGPIFTNTETEVASVSGIKTIVECNQYHQQESKVTFYDIKGDFEVLLRELGLSKYQMKSGAAQYYHPYKSGTICLGKEVLGYIGHLHPFILKQLGIKSDVLAFELYLDKLPEGRLSYGKKAQYNVYDYPVVKRDFAFVIDTKRNVGEIIGGVAAIDRNIIKNVELFDVYKLPDQQNKHSIAIRVYIQDSKTMNDTDISQLSDKIISYVNKNFDGVLRLG